MEAPSSTSSLARGGRMKSPNRPVLIILIVIIVGGLLWAISRDNKPVQTNVDTIEETGTGEGVGDAEGENLGVWVQGKVREPHVEPKIAFLFLLNDDHNQIKIWEKFYKDSEGQFEIFVRSEKTKDVKKQKLLKDKLTPPTGTTEIARIRDTLDIMRLALKKRGVEMILFITEFHVPIETFDELYDTLMTTPRASRAYYKAWKELPSDAKDRYAKLTNRDNSTGGISEHNFYWHPSVISLNRKHAELLVANDMTKLWENVPSPQEHYWLTTLAHLGARIPKEVDRKCLSMPEPEAPTLYTKKLTPKNVADFASSECPLASKFAKDSDINSHWNFILEAREGEDEFAGVQ